MFRKACCLLVLAELWRVTAWAQEVGMKFNAPRNQAAQVDRVFDKNDRKTVKGNVANVLPDQKVVGRVPGAAPLVATTAMRPLPPQVRGLPVEFELSKESANSVVVNNVRPAPVSAWEQSSVAKGQLPDLNRSVAMLGENFQKFLDSPTRSPSEYKAIADSAEQAHEALVASFAATPKTDTAKLDELARLTSPFIDFKRKATYGLDDNFWPEVYEKMYFHSRSVTAIGLQGGPGPVGTGALIGNSLVLTCSHVFEEDVKDYEVIFDFEETSVGPLPKKAFPVASLVFEGAVVAGLGNQPLDFVLLKIGPDRDGKLCEQHGYKPLPLTRQVCRLEDPVYVIGHPNSAARTVHDNARVIFAYILSDKRKSDLDLRVRAQILEYVEREFTDVAERERVRDDLLEDLAQSFIKTDTGFKYVSEVRGPSIGIDSDTSGGNSGAPVFLRRGAGKTAGIVGVFVGGAGRGADRADFLRHEVALPITEVIDQINQAQPNWANAHGVNVHTP